MIYFHKFWEFRMIKRIKTSQDKEKCNSLRHSLYSLPKNKNIYVIYTIGSPLITKSENSRQKYGLLSNQT